MKVLSIKQPWAELIVAGVKDVENRTWSTSYLGPVLIHTSKTVDHAAYSELQRQGHPLPPCVQGFTRGAIIGAARLTDSTLVVNSQWHEMGLYGFYLEDAIRLDEPIPCRGHLGLFSLECANIRPDQKRELEAWVRRHIPESKVEKRYGK